MRLESAAVDISEIYGENLARVRVFVAELFTVRSSRSLHFGRERRSLREKGGKNANAQ